MVNLLVKKEEKEFNTKTDSTGKYSFETLAGNIIIEFSKEGYIKKTLSQKISENSSLNIVLEKDSKILDEVIISNKSDKLISKSSGDKISFNPQNLKEVPSISGTTDIIKILQLIPGVQNAGDGNGYLYVRGGDPGQNLMLYSHTPIYGMSHLLGFFPFYNSDHIKEFNFDKSNSDAKYGGRLSSTLAVTPIEKKSQKKSISGNVGLLASQITLFTPIGKKNGIYLSARKTYIDELIKPLIKNNSSQSNNTSNTSNGSKYSFSDCNFTFISEINDKDHVYVNAFISGDQFSNQDPKLDLNSKLKWHNFAITPTWKKEISKNTLLRNSIYLSEYGNKLDINQSAVKINIESHIQDYGYSGAINYLIQKIPCESGIQFSFADINPQNIIIQNSGNTNIDKRPEKIEAVNFSLYTSSKPKLTNKISSDFGLRLHYYNANSNHSLRLNLEPRISLYYHPNDDLSFFSLYTRQNQYINLITTSTVGIPSDFWIGTSDGIPSQSSNEFSIGGNKILSSTYNNSFCLYYRFMNNLIEYPYSLTQFNDITTLKNDILVGSGKSYGFEYLLKKDKGKLKGWLSYTLSWSTRKFDEINNGNQFYSKYDRRHNLSFVSTYLLNTRWSFGLTQIFSSGSRFTAPTAWYFINNNPVKEYGAYNNAQLPNYIRTDLSINYWITRSNEKESALCLSLFNTFNIDNPIYLTTDIMSQGENNIVIHINSTTLYRFLPSISWRFKY